MKRSPRINILLFILTCMTTLMAGAIQKDIDLWAEPHRIWEGLPFSATLMVILLSHEFGHYFASLRHRVDATLPFFIPVPPNIFPFGTMGAVISMKSPIMTRRALIDIGASGPIIGFILSVIAVIIGLSMSQFVMIEDIVMAPDEFGMGSSLLFTFLVHQVMGPFPAGAVLDMHPVAFAGWIGLFVTMLNLLPVGQLDGGHIMYALLGERQRVAGVMVLGLLLGFGLLWPGWIIWAILLLVIGLRHPPVSHWESRLDMQRRIVGILSAIIFILTFMPVPFFSAEVLKNI